MNKSDLLKRIKQTQGALCVGLDPDLAKIPPHLLKESDPIFTFNKAIIDATHDLTVAYKPNIAFYEALGPKGWESLQKTMEYIPKGIFTIADAKRGDIGNTSQMYAKTFFEYMNFDSITVSPYMGSDSLAPYLTYPDKWIIVLAVTSNPSSTEYETQRLENGKYLFEQVIETTQAMESNDRIMYVVGATKTEYISAVRKCAPSAFLLVPGVGAQGGNMRTVFAQGQTTEGVGLLINSSRGILYSSPNPDFAVCARKSAQELVASMGEHLSF